MKNLLAKGLTTAMIGIPIGANMNMPMDNLNLRGVKIDYPINYHEPKPVLPKINDIPRIFRSSNPLKIKKDTTLPTVQQSTLDLIKDFEKFSPRAYDDGFGNITIGYGFTRNDMPYLDWGDTISEKDASVKLKEIIEDKYEQFINRNIKVKITQEQFDALASWIYNVGETVAKRSTLLKMLNRGHFELAAKEFPKWNRVRKNGRRVDVKGLTIRREKERRLFLSIPSI